MHTVFPSSHLQNISLLTGKNRSGCSSTSRMPCGEMRAAGVFGDDVAAGPPTPPGENGGGATLRSGVGFSFVDVLLLTSVELSSPTSGIDTQLPYTTYNMHICKSPGELDLSSV
jgi:hypothetical protein